MNCCIDNKDSADKMVSVANTTTNTGETNMGYFKALFQNEVVAEGWARGSDEFAKQKKLDWYWENGGLEIVGGY